MGFDAPAAKAKAWRRLQDVVEGRIRGDVRKEERRWYEDVAATQDMERLLKWCKRRGLTVEFVSHGAGSYEGTVVKVPSRLRLRNQLIVLLHECGHHVIGDAPRYVMGYQSEHDGNKSRSLHHRLTVLEEEMEAWHRGWDLSQQLKLSVDKTSYDKEKVARLRTYLEWCVEKERFE